MSSFPEVGRNNNKKRHETTQCEPQFHEIRISGDVLDRNETWSFFPLNNVTIFPLLYASFVFTVSAVCGSLQTTLDAQAQKSYGHAAGSEMKGGARIHPVYFEILHRLGCMAPCIPCRDVRENSSHVTCDAEFLWFMVFSESGYFPLAMWPSSSLKGDRTSSWKYLQYLQCLKFLWHPILNEMLYEVKGSFHLVHAKLQRWLSNKAHELKNGQIEGDHCNRLHSERFNIILILSRIVRSVLLKVKKRGFQTFPPQVSKETGGISGSLFFGYHHASQKRSDRFTRLAEMFAHSPHLPCFSNTRDETANFFKFSNRRSSKPLDNIFKNRTRFIPD